LLLPVVALLGFSQAGHEVSNLIARDPNWIERVLAAAKVPPRSQREVLYRLDDVMIVSFAALVALTLLARGARYAYERRSRIDPSQRARVSVPRNFSVLEASRFANIPSVDLRRARCCSTCRVRVTHVFPPPAARRRTECCTGSVRRQCRARPSA
jgi:ferredoxin